MSDDKPDNVGQPYPPQEGDVPPETLPPAEEPAEERSHDPIEREEDDGANEEVDSES